MPAILNPEGEGKSPLKSNNLLMGGGKLHAGANYCTFGTETPRRGGAPGRYMSTGFIPEIFTSSVASTRWPLRKSVNSSGLLPIGS
jgi:hypothetical protein